MLANPVAQTMTCKPSVICVIPYKQWNLSRRWDLPYWEYTITYMSQSCLGLWEKQTWQHPAWRLDWYEDLLDSQFCQVTVGKSRSVDIVCTDIIKPSVSVLSGAYSCRLLTNNCSILFEEGPVALSILITALGRGTGDLFNFRPYTWKYPKM